MLQHRREKSWVCCCNGVGWWVCCPNVKDKEQALGCALKELFEFQPVLIQMDSSQSTKCSFWSLVRVSFGLAQCKKNKCTSETACTSSVSFGKGSSCISGCMLGSKLEVEKVCTVAMHVFPPSRILANGLAFRFISFPFGTEFNSSSDHSVLVWVPTMRDCLTLHS